MKMEEKGIYLLEYLKACIDGSMKGDDCVGNGGLKICEDIDDGENSPSFSKKCPPERKGKECLTTKSKPLVHMKKESTAKSPHFCDKATYFTILMTALQVLRKNRF